MKSAEPTEFPGGSPIQFKDATPDEAIETLIKAADLHGEDYPDHTVGDLQDMLRAAWSMMTDEQRATFLRHEQVLAAIEAGGMDVPRLITGAANGAGRRP